MGLTPLPEMRMRTLFFGLSLLISMAAAEAACVSGVRANDVLNMREYPTNQAAIVGVLAPAACGITVTGQCSGNWCVVAFNGLSGWVNMRYIAQAAAPAPGPAGLCVVGVAGNDRLNVRAGPGSRHAILDSLGPRACGVRRTGPCSGNWCEIDTGRSIGWANMRYLR